MYKTFSFKCIACLVLALMMALPFAACTPPIDDEVSVGLDPTDAVVEDTVEPEETENVEATVEPEETENVEATENADATEAVETEAAKETQSASTKAPETKNPATKAPATTAPATKTPETKAPETKTPIETLGKMGNFSTEDLNGKSYSAKDLYAGNKLTMINVWGTDCGPCIKEMPYIEQLAKELAGKGFKVYGVLQDSEKDGMLEKGKDIVASAKTSYVHLRNMDSINNALLNRFGVRQLPTTFFLDSEGNILKKVTGGNTYDSWKTIITDLLAAL